MEIKQTGAEAAKASFAELGKHTGAAIADTLNPLANGTQAMTRDEIRRRMTLRRPTFVLNTIYRKPGEDFATPTKAQASVRVDPARDFLAKFETGGIKGPVEGNSIALPLGVRRLKSDIIRVRDRPRGLMGSKQVVRVGDLLIRFQRKKITPLYRFLRQVRIPDRMNMRQNAEKVVQREFETVAQRAIDKAIAKAFK